MVPETSFSEITVGEIVAQDFRTAGIFRKAGIDFCCGGKKSLAQACEEKNINPSQILDQLNHLDAEGGIAINYNEWEPGFLCEYIVNTHHTYVKKTLPELVWYTAKIASVHASHHPELLKVENLFAQINKELTVHLKNEEDVLFPAIKRMKTNASEEDRQLIQSEIMRMSEEHEFAGGAMDKINAITQGYKLPADACNTYQVAFKMLEQFENDLHNHVHLENNILYPKALKL
jgi:regulator of cell morphogenesis and NO signaling